MITFDFSGIADWQQEWHPVAFTVALLSAPCGFNRITQESLGEVSDRIMQYQLVVGAALSAKSGKVYITPKDVARLVGLRTNASPMTDRQWKAHLAEIAPREAVTLHSQPEAYGVLPAKANQSTPAKD